MMSAAVDFASLVDELKSREEIKELKAKYCRFVDTKQWDRLAALFDEKASFEGFGSAPNGADAATFVLGVSTRMVSATTVHHCHTPEIVFENANEARGLWAMEDYVQFAPGTVVVEANGSPGFRGFGHYEERYLRRDGRWRLLSLRLTRIRIDALPADHPPPRPGFMATTPDWI
jgi:hypothetical protein